MLPLLVNDHKKLMYLNTNDLPVFKDVLVPGIDVQPLFLDVEKNIWVLRTIYAPGATLPTHYHTGTVHVWTVSGKWHYIEHPDEPQTAGCYLYEPGGSVHTFMIPEDNTEPTETIIFVEGANVNFDAEGNYHSVMDANSLMLLFDHLVKEHGMEPARYISRPGSRFTG